MFEFGHASLDLLNVEVHVVREVRADAGLGVAHRAVQRRPAHTDHHGSQTQEEEESDTGRVSCRRRSQTQELD